MSVTQEETNKVFSILINRIRSKDDFISVIFIIIILSGLLSMVVPYIKIKWVLWFSIGVMGFYFMGWL